MATDPSAEQYRSGPAVETLIRPRRRGLNLGLGEALQSRELLYFLIWRDVTVRYKQTLLGGSWAILQPVLTMAVFSLFFGRLGKIPSDGLPYPLFSLAGLVPWTFFATGLGQAANSLVASANLLKKVYFPRVLIPIGAVLAGVVDVAFATLALVVMMIIYRVVPGLSALWALPLLALAAATAIGAGLWASALNVLYRDVRYVVSFGLNLWLFATPIAYPASLLPPQWRTVYALNPMVGVVEGVRWALLRSGEPPLEAVVVSTATAVLLLLSGLVFFNHMERRFADVV